MSYTIGIDIHIALYSISTTEDKVYFSQKTENHPSDKFSITKIKICATINFFPPNFLSVTYLN